MLTNGYLKSIVLKYVVNTFEYKEQLALKYLLVFFKIKIPKFRKNNSTVKDLDKILYNVRWYISESYLEDIKILNSKVDLEEFWIKLQNFWYISTFTENNRLLDNVYNFNIRFRFNNRVESCLVYKDVYLLSISHEYIKSNFFDKIVNYLFYQRNIRISKLSIHKYYIPTSVSNTYDIIVKLYNEYPEDYKIIDGFLVT